MSSSRTPLSRRRALALLAGAPALAACGFSPAYAPGGAATRLRGQVRPAAPDSRDGFTFARRIEDRLGRADAARFTLDYTLRTDSEGLAITPDQETLRYNLIGTARFSVVDGTDGTVVTSGSVDSFTSYSAIGTTVATRASERDARERLAVILADDVVAQLVATAPGWLS